MKRFLLLSAIALLLGGSTQIFAQGYYDRRGPVNDRTDRQRVQHGRRAGQITRDEARELFERDRQIQAERRAYHADGRLSREERREIRRDERDHDRMIRRYRRNDEYRSRNHDRDAYRRGNGYYRRGAGSPNHQVFGRGNRY